MHSRRVEFSYTLGFLTPFLIRHPAMHFFLIPLAPELRSRRRLRYPAASLEGKAFFLHIQSASKARDLEKKIKELGGVSIHVHLHATTTGCLA